MAQVKLLKIDADGVPVEFGASDDITLNSFTAGSGPVVSPTGIVMNNQDITDISDVTFNDPATATLNQTAGSLIIDNLMAKERANVMAAGSDILFGVVADVSAELDAFKVPHSAALPTQPPAYSSDAGYLVSASGSLFLWDGSVWNDLGVSDSANTVQNTYFAEETIGANDFVYISSANNVSKALADNTSKSYVIGASNAGITLGSQGYIFSEGVLEGFSALTPGSRYYLSDSTAGGVTATVPSGSGKTIVQVGYAKSATALHLHIEQMGRRA